jgi:hypothetical protein
MQSKCFELVEICRVRPSGPAQRKQIREPRIPNYTSNRNCINTYEVFIYPAKSHSQKIHLDLNMQFTHSRRVSYRSPRAPKETGEVTSGPKNTVFKLVLSGIRRTICHSFEMGLFDCFIITDKTSLMIISY